MNDRYISNYDKYTHLGNISSANQRKYFARFRLERMLECSPPIPQGTMEYYYLNIANQVVTLENSDEIKMCEEFLKHVDEWGELMNMLYNKVISLKQDCKDVTDILDISDDTIHKMIQERCRERNVSTNPLPREHSNGRFVSAEAHRFSEEYNKICEEVRNDVKRMKREAIERFPEHTTDYKNTTNNITIKNLRGITGIDDVPSIPSLPTYRFQDDNPYSDMLYKWRDAKDYSQVKLWLYNWNFVRGTRTAFELYDIMTKRDFRIILQEHTDVF